MEYIVIRLNGDARMHRKCLIMLIPIIVITAGGLRIATIKDLSLNGHPILMGYDSYYHLRRADLLLNGVSIPETDFFSAYPQGAQAHWSPVFDVMGCIFLRMGMMRGIEKETAISFLPVVLGLLGILAILPFFSRSDPPYSIAAALFLAAILPADIRPANYGFTDHHVLELLLTTLALTMLCRTNRLHTALLTGFLLGFSQFTWRGALIVTMIAGFSLFCLSFIPLRGISPQTWSRHGAIIMGTAAVTYITFSLTGHISLHSLSFFDFSLFQALPFLILGILFLIRYTWSRNKTFPAISLAILFAVSATVFLHSTGPVWMEGFDFLLGKHAWRETISESRSLFRGIVFPPWNAVEELFSGLFYLTPALILYQIFQLKRRMNPARYLIVIVWCLTLLVLTLKQQRYAHQMSVPFILILILSLDDLKPAFRKLSLPVRSIVVLFVILSFAPVMTFHYNLIRYGRNTWKRIPDAQNQAFKWMLAHTPDPGSFLEPDKLPMYGIMNAWDSGHWITWIARRAPIANNFGAEPGGHRQGLEASCRFYTTSDNAEALSIVDSKRARFVVTENFGDKLAGFAYIIGLLDDWKKQNPEPPVSMKLHLLNGSDGQGPEGQLIPGVDGFRLVFVSDQITTLSDKRPVPAVKIFERVQGARIRVPTDANPPYRLSLNMRTENNRVETIVRVWTQPMDELPLYYSFSDCPYACRPSGPARLDWPGGTAFFTAGEETVLSGGLAERLVSTD